MGDWLAIEAFDEGHQASRALSARSRLTLYAANRSVLIGRVIKKATRGQLTRIRFVGSVPARLPGQHTKDGNAGERAARQEGRGGAECRP